jgi:hypothetical protein
MTEKTRRTTKEILISMTNITVAMKAAEDSLAENNLAVFCKNLKEVEQGANWLRREIEFKFGLPDVPR